MSRPDRLRRTARRSQGGPRRPSAGGHHHRRPRRARRHVGHAGGRRRRAPDGESRPRQPFDLPLGAPHRARPRRVDRQHAVPGVRRRVPAAADRVPDLSPAIVARAQQRSHRRGDRPGVDREHRPGCLRAAHHVARRLPHAWHASPGSETRHVEARAGRRRPGQARPRGRGVESPVRLAPRSATP